jgi:hypothetical protein
VGEFALARVFAARSADSAKGSVNLGRGGKSYDTQQSATRHNTKCPSIGCAWTLFRFIPATRRRYYLRFKLYWPKRMLISELIAIFDHASEVFNKTTRSARRVFRPTDRRFAVSRIAAWEEVFQPV